jgi:nucleotide-binding universal stress UspA family protein
VFKTIVWATDGSDAADRALPYAKALAGEHDAALVVVHSEEFLIGPRAGGVPVHPDEEELQAKIKGQVDELRGAGVDASFKLVGGPSLTGAGHMIADAARDVDADLVIVGTRGHTAHAGLMLGSEAQRLLHLAPCPVMAVPSGSSGS